MSYNPPSGPASPSALGTIQLSGDLSGAAKSPKVAKINGTLVEGSGQLTLGSATLRNGCKKHTATVSLVSNLFSI